MSLRNMISSDYTSSVRFYSNCASIVGPTGVRGLAGTAANTGATGPAGPVGTAGATGATGPVGTAGATGPVGPAGPAGTAGEAGATGPAGATGTVGPVGTAGATGATGPAGTAGAVGTAGPAGSTGAVGATGPVGTAGPTGTPGPTGEMGPAGAAGATGEMGPTGEAGNFAGTNYRSFTAFNYLQPNGTPYYNANENGTELGTFIHSAGVLIVHLGVAYLYSGAPLGVTINIVDFFDNVLATVYLDETAEGLTITESTIYVSTFTTQAVKVILNADSISGLNSVQIRAITLGFA